MKTLCSLCVVVNINSVCQVEFTEHNLHKSSHVGVKSTHRSYKVLRSVKQTTE